ncbi:hypothetical protein E1B28_011872 [Marasmius oreades]|uniref:F-box domain-containing protein n=1 Tax=Marasmius oreades TaxID=181124 RepID=A0A9P7UQP5_9AGAR|nr:uncharacterized protein E1B28_011872 [Marasmius oreades]KAG7090275.1 hypothetical protein E1B28_011872 [Marasmius oreades]
MAPGADLTEGRRWPDVFDYENGPWAISKVCSSWRRTVTASPEVWRRFMLGTRDLGSKGQFSALETWLRYSRTSTISFLIYTHGICDHVVNRELFRMLLSQSNRWENIEFVNTTTSFWEMLNEYNVRKQLASLRSFTILSDGDTSAYLDEPDYDPEDDPDFYGAFREAPQLRSISCLDFIIISKIPGVHFPWTQITKFESSIRCSENYRILNNVAPNLEWLRLELTSDDIKTVNCGQSTDDIICLPKLRTLAIKIYIRPPDHPIVEQPVSSFRRINHLSFPSLENLSITTEFSFLLAPFHIFAEALRHSPCTLQSLEISGYTRETEDIFKLLKAVPTVRHFCLWIDLHGPLQLQDVVLPQLMGRGDEALLPRLDILELKFPERFEIYELDKHPLAALIRFRWANQETRIRTIRLSLGADIRGKVYRLYAIDTLPCLSSLDDLKEEGLTVDVRGLVTV